MNSNRAGKEVLRAAKEAKRAGAGAAVPVASRKRTKRSDAEAPAAVASTSKRRRGSKK